ncbi:MAG: hypothetical protein EYC62_02520 [Alphaproteobacteria bacterium]|nr:MAG: hypothetical protein EYC62_02520 [Alphaproteobacteria bacterium]
MLPELSLPKTSNATKDILVPMFYRRAVQDKLASEQQGRPIFREEDYIQIHIPGDKNTIIDRKVRDDDRARWADQWKAYTENAAQPVEGTPLEQWPALSVSQIAELRAMHVPTVEVLAELSDQGLQRIGMGARELQAKAKAFLEASKDNGAVERIAAENLRLQEQIAELHQKNEFFLSQIKELKSLIQDKKKEKLKLKTE